MNIAKKYAEDNLMNYFTETSAKSGFQTQEVWNSFYINFEIYFLLLKLLKFYSFSIKYLTNRFLSKQRKLYTEIT